MTTLKTCSTEGCAGALVCKGVCRKCYNRNYVRASPRTAEQKRKRHLARRATPEGRKKENERRKRTRSAVKTDPERLARQRFSRGVRMAIFKMTPPGRASIRAQRAKRRAQETKACPVWADMLEIRKIYEGTPPGHHVDHIVPLRGEKVCGLHVAWNLQYLPAEENLRKGNKLG